MITSNYSKIADSRTKAFKRMKKYQYMKIYNKCRKIDKERYANRNNVVKGLDITI